VSSADPSQPATGDAPSCEPEPRPKGAWLRRVGVLALAVALALGLGWLHPLTRHRLLLTLTALERRWSADAGVPAAPAETRAAHWVHAAWATDDLRPNSGPSARAACRTFRGVEVDVAFSTDLVPYVSHDHDFARLSGKPQDRLSLHSAAEIDAIRGPEGEPALRLAALVSEAACEVLILDVKTDHRRADAKAAALLEALGSRRQGVWALSMSGPFLQALGGRAPELRLGCEGYLPLGNSLAGFHVSSLDRAQVTSSRDAAARARGLLRLYWTARDPAQLKELQAWSPDALLFDAPRIPREGLPAETRLEGGS
jgi:glycerophosphoryl diester phosphodiesterase